VSKIGPFFDEKFLKHLLEELTKNLTYFAVVYPELFSSPRIELTSGKAAFLGDVRAWGRKYLGKEFDGII
jgi:hypothetical protein